MIRAGLACRPPEVEVWGGRFPFSLISFPRQMALEGCLDRLVLHPYKAGRVSWGLLTLIAARRRLEFEVSGEDGRGFGCTECTGCRASMMKSA